MKKIVKVLSFGWQEYKKYFDLSIADLPYVMIQEVNDSHGLCIAISIYHKKDYAKIETSAPKRPHFLLVFDFQTQIHQLDFSFRSKEDYFPTYEKYCEYCKIHNSYSVSKLDYQWFEENVGIQTLLLLIFETLPKLFFDGISDYN